MLVPTISTVIFLFLTVLLLRVINATGQNDILPLSGDELPENPPMVSIIVPMRNEQRNAKRCLESLLSQNYPIFEIIAIDDRSEDNTLCILKELASKHSNLKVVEGKPLPKDWVGKNHAIWQGIQYAKGEWLLFTDADTVSDPNMLPSVINYVVKNGIDMLSISPFQILETFWERVIQPVIFCSIHYAFSRKKVNDPRSKTAAANGQFILIKHSVYQELGGHLAIKDKIVEDFALAKLVKERGYRLIVLRGIRLVKTRMYTSFSEIWEGWTKNLFLGIGQKWGLLLYFTITLFLWGFTPFILLGWSIFGFFYTQISLTSLLITLTEGLVLFTLVTYNAWSCTRFFRLPSYYAFTFPLGISIYIAIILSSTYKVVSGKGVTWKGRRYRVQELG
ncbi:MAG: glycosyl transferase [Deltaproteobacteria bacterium]|jgi:chlorobactene glucosyltransferase|nr:MAG: glycosyl transferase [Deltaproteobacteria bacterium]